MKQLLYKLYAKLSGTNPQNMPVAAIKEQLFEVRALPLGKAEFDSWSDRIIAGAAIDGSGEDPEAFKTSQRFVLANMIMQLGPTESHKPDAHFIHSLRKVAINQIAEAVRQEHFSGTKRRLEAIEGLKREGYEVGVDAIG